MAAGDPGVPMASYPAPKDLKVGLVAGDAATRQAALERMRGKLAAGSPTAPPVLSEGRRRVIRRNNLAWFAWGWRMALVALFLGANAYLVFNHEPEIAARAKVRKAPAVKMPETLSENDQALYWTYALYDFDRLVTTYGAPKGAVVAAPVAKAHLARLLPKVDKRTRFTIQRYLPKGSQRI